MDILYEDKENVNIKYFSFIGKSNTRFDLAIINTERFFGKILVINILSGKTIILGKDDLEEPAYLEYEFNISEEEAEDLHEFLSDYLQ